MFDIALEVPLAALTLGRFLQSDDPGATGIEVFHETFDRTALAGSIASFEQDHDPLAGFPDPALYLQQFDLQFRLVLFIGLAAHLVLVGINALTKDPGNGFGVLPHLCQFMCG